MDESRFPEFSATTLHPLVIAEIAASALCGFYDQFIS